MILKGKKLLLAIILSLSGGAFIAFVGFLLEGVPNG